MTLKEKIAEAHPNMIYKRAPAGICGCPRLFPETAKAPENKRCKNKIDCLVCWNQEWEEEYAVDTRRI